MSGAGGRPAPAVAALLVATVGLAVVVAGCGSSATGSRPPPVTAAATRLQAPSAAAAEREPRLIVAAGGRTREGHVMAAVARAALPGVLRVWPDGWPADVRILAPATVHRFRALVSVASGRSDLAAVALPGSATAARIVVDPAVWPRLSRTGRLVVLRHELTHVATAGATGPATPRWLVEGFADWVGFRHSGLPAGQVAAALAHPDSAGIPQRLPASRDFDAADRRRAVRAYDEAWLACRAVVARWGWRRLVSFYRAVGSSTASPARAVRSAARTVLGTTRAALLRRWRAEIRAVVAGAG